MDIVTVLVQLISGAVGGNIAGNLLKKLSLGSVGNSIEESWAAASVACCSMRLGVGTSAGGVDVGSVIGSIAGGGIVAACCWPSRRRIIAVKNAMGKSA